MDDAVAAVLRREQRSLLSTALAQIGLVILVPVLILIFALTQVRGEDGGRVAPGIFVVGGALVAVVIVPNAARVVIATIRRGRALGRDLALRNYCLATGTLTTAATGSDDGPTYWWLQIGDTTLQSPWGNNVTPPFASIQSARVSYTPNAGLILDIVDSDGYTAYRATGYR